MTRRQLVAVAALVTVVAIGAIAALTVPNLLAQSTGGVPQFVDEATSSGVLQKSYAIGFRLAMVIGAGLVVLSALLALVMVEGKPVPHLQHSSQTSP